MVAWGLTAQWPGQNESVGWKPTHIRREGPGNGMGAKRLFCEPLINQLRPSPTQNPPWANIPVNYGPRSTKKNTLCEHLARLPLTCVVQQLGGMENAPMVKRETHLGDDPSEFESSNSRC